MASHPVNETIRLFPTRRLEAPISVPLSILDCTTTRFSPTGCIWIFDNHADIPKTHVLLDRLKRSFVSTLDDFPQWAGQLQWASFNPTGEYTERFNRLNLVYGSIHDPGIEWKTVLYPENNADQFVPAPSERICAKIWRGDEFPESMFVSDCALALYDLKSYEGLPGMSVQISLFGDGGYAVGLKLAHPLGDAQSLMTFVNMWANKSQNLGGHEKNSPLYSSPIFNPKLLDDYASGELNESTVDANYASVARALPLHRYDCWECDNPDMPFFFKEQFQKIAPPTELLEKAILSPAHGERLENLRSTFRNGTGQSKVSRLDILLSLLWSAINRARGMNQSSDEVFLDLTVGARARLSPPLPDSWLGSPLFLTYVKRTGAQICSADLASISESIRNTISLFSPEKISAMLHDTAYEVSPLRLWQSFLGQRHVMVTSWLRLDVQHVSFEECMVRPRYAHAIMPKVDGVVQVFDSAINDGGMSVALYLDAETMEKLIGDDALKEN